MTIPEKEFFIALELVLNSTYFTFNGEIYKQNFGTPMGSPLSPIIADLIMQDLEIAKAIAMLGFQLGSSDNDIVMAVPSDMIDFILTTFNSFHPRLQFILEIGGNSINFLDVTIINNNNYSNIVLNFHFDWENVQILDKEKFLNKRLISEIAFIHMQRIGLNLCSNIEGHTYAAMLENFFC